MRPIISQDKILEIVINKHYTGSVFRLLLFFMAITEYDNRIKYYTQKEISQKIKMTQSEVSAAIRTLDTDGIIKKDGRDWYFSDELLVKGNSK
jgi:DNA-binding MarR family transcriptional regulator